MWWQLLYRLPIFLPSLEWFPIAHFKAAVEGVLSSQSSHLALALLQGFQSRLGLGWSAQVYLYLTPSKWCLHRWSWLWIQSVSHSFQLLWRSTPWISLYLYLDPQLSSTWTVANQTLDQKSFLFSSCHILWTLPFAHLSRFSLPEWTCMRILQHY